jgi:hypothetical protein
MSRILAIALFCGWVAGPAAAAGLPLYSHPAPPHALDGPFRYTGPYQNDVGAGPPVVEVPPVEGHFRRFGPYPARGSLPAGPYPPGPAVTLPEGMSLEIDPPDAAIDVPAKLDRWRQVGDFLRTCWAPPPAPAGAAPGSREVTLRLGFDRSGTILGQPRVTFSQPPATTQEQKAFTSAARAALAHCAPLPFTAGLGSAIAGVPFTLHFTDRQTAVKSRKPL